MIPPSCHNENPLLFLPACPKPPSKLYSLVLVVNLDSPSNSVRWRLPTSQLYAGRMGATVMSKVLGLILFLLATQTGRTRAQTASCGSGWGWVRVNVLPLTQKLTWIPSNNLR